jgi:hypothetical protein
MTSRFRPLIASLLPLAALTFAPGCADSGAEPRGLVVSTAALAPCVPNENGDFRFPSNADRVVVRATGGRIPAESPIIGVFASNGANGPEQALLEEVPAGQGVLIEVVACQGPTATWGGLTRGVEVLAANRNTAEVFLTPVNASACIGGKGVAEDDRQMNSGHAFAAAAADGEAAYALGGFGAYNLASLELRATPNVDKYSRVQSRFDALSPLQEPRAMAAAQMVASDGTIRVIGGVRAVTLVLKGDRPPLFPSPDSAPSVGVEVYDPISGTPLPGPDSPLPALPALGAAPDGTVIAAGGIQGTDTYAAGVTVFGVDGTIKSFGMPSGRYGAVVLATEDGHALVYGGASSGDPTTAAFWLDLTTSTATALTDAAVGGMPFMPAGLYMGKGADGWRFVIIGGSDIKDGAGGTEFTAGAATARAVLVTVDPSGGSMTTRDLLATGGLNKELFRRLAPTLVDLGDLGLVLAGGLTSLTSDPACPEASDCLPQTIARLALDTDGGELALVGTPSVASVAAFGGGLLDLGDGSWLLAGGIETLAAAARAIDLDASLLRFGVVDPGMCEVVAP